MIQAMGIIKVTLEVITFVILSTLKAFTICIPSEWVSKEVFRSHKLAPPRVRPLLQLAVACQIWAKEITHWPIPARSNKKSTLVAQILSQRVLSHQNVSNVIMTTTMMAYPLGMKIRTKRMKMPPSLLTIMPSNKKPLKNLSANL
jgi:hypothetical protein